MEIRSSLQKGSVYYLAPSLAPGLLPFFGSFPSFFRKLPSFPPSLIQVPRREFGTDWEILEGETGRLLDGTTHMEKTLAGG